MKNFWIIALLAILSCDKNTVVVPEFEGVDSDRVVLLEEMTGVSCPNCPKGTAEIEAIKELYGDQVIPVGIHGLFLSWPTKESEFDFRNDFAKQLELTLAPGTSKPAALFNRALPSGENNRVIQSPDLWGGYVEEQLNRPPSLQIELDISYDSEERKANLNVGVVGVEDINDALSISVMVLENNIIDAQEDLNEVIEEFHHNHVLRTMLTPYSGETLTGPLSTSQIINRSYEFEVPVEDHLWKLTDLEFVVFVHSTDLEGEVYQAALIKLPL